MSFYSVVVWVLIGLVLAVVAFAAYVRLGPLNAAQAHEVALPVGPAGVAPAIGSHTVIMDVADPAAAMVRLDEVAGATARTRRVAGSVDSGRVTYVTRSAFWGFPDFTTIEARPDAGQIALFGRLKVGRADFGVNRARVEAWLAALDAAN